MRMRIWMMASLPYDIVLHTLRVCVCVCVCERERDFHSVTDHPVWWNDTFYLHCDSESHFLQIWTFCNLYTCQNGKISSIFFTHFEMFPSFFHYLVLAGRLDALFFFFLHIYFLIPGNQAEWGITSFRFILVPFSSTSRQSCSLRPLFEQRMNVFSHAPKRLYSLPLFLLLLQFLFTSVSHDWWWAIEISFCV